MATATAPETALPEHKPETAQQAIAMTRDDHNWAPNPPDVNSTDGIKRNITALWDAINRLAAYVDGDKTSPDAPKPHAQPDKNHAKARA